MAGTHERSALSGVFGERGGEVGLADARLAADDNDRSAAGHGLFQMARQQFKLGFAADGRNAALGVLFRAGIGHRNRQPMNPMKN